MNIYVLSALSTYMTAIDLVRESVGIKGIIGLPMQEETDAISGYYYYKDYCNKHSIEFHEVEKYSLKSSLDQDRLASLDIDYLLVLGWQRLIPDWLIKQCNKCAIGAHGSADGITMGRGRSPQNWALILGKPYFYISIFEIDEGIDSGSVIDTRRFGYNEHDTILTSYHKVSWLTGKMIADNINSGMSNGNIQAVEQQGEPRYLPQRKPEDGALDWSRTSKQIHDFVRALTKPYPGAWTETDDGGRISIWSGAPFRFTDIQDSYAPGQVVASFQTGEFVVKTIDGYYIVHEWSANPSSIGNLVPGQRLKSEPYADQLQRIVSRHYAKYPDLIISEDITSLLP